MLFLVSLYIHQKYWMNIFSKIVFQLLQKRKKYLQFVWNNFINRIYIKNILFSSLKSFVINRHIHVAFSKLPLFIINDDANISCLMYLGFHKKRNKIFIFGGRNIRNKIICAKPLLVYQSMKSIICQSNLILAAILPVKNTVVHLSYY